MRYSVGDRVEVRVGKAAPWFEGVVQEDSDEEHYVVKLLSPLNLSTLHGIGFKRDLKTDIVMVKKHLETIGLGHLHLRSLKENKDTKTKTK